MKRIFSCYEIKSPDDNYGLVGSFETVAEALFHINRSYQHAKSLGYDNSYEKWVIVCVERVKEFNSKGEFVKEEITRFVSDYVEYSFYNDAYLIHI